MVVGRQKIYGDYGSPEVPFGTFDYLGVLTKFPKFHRASPFGRGPCRGRIPREILGVYRAFVFFSRTRLPVGQRS